MFEKDNALRIGTAAGALRFYPLELQGQLHVRIMDLTGKMLEEFNYEATEGYEMGLNLRGTVWLQVEQEGVSVAQRLLFLPD